MISIDQALQIVLESALRAAPEPVPLADALNLVLAENIASGIDSPPHDKSTVDGYAVVAADLATGTARLAILEEITAGDVPHSKVKPGSATRIMTGAPIPSGANAVVMIEQTQIDETAVRPMVEVFDSPLRVGENIMPRGTSLRVGETVLSANQTIRPIEVGLLAEIGRTEVLAFRRPQVAILATGNELVPANRVPAPGQIRNSNGPMIRALVEQAGGVSNDLGIGRDEKEALATLVREGLHSDVLVLSGGVSAGVLDLVPEVLEMAGVETVFHRVQLKPGKPLWFGVKRQPSGNCLVFGLPGNPVSSLVCFELFVRPVLQKLRGHKPSGLERQEGILATEHAQQGQRPTYFPGVLSIEGARREVRTLNWQGSADQRSLTEANCLIYFPPGDRIFTSGTVVPIFLL